MFNNGDIILIALAALAILGVWPMILFRKSILAAWITIGSLIYLSVFCFKVMYRMEFYGWGYAVMVLLAILRVTQLQRLKGAKSDQL